MLINIQVDEFLRLIWDVVLLEGAVHIQRPSESFPGVAGRMLIQINIAVQDLIQRLLTTHIDHVVVLGVQVNDPELSRLLGQGADSERLILPPRLGETVSVPLRIRSDGWDVQVSAQRAMPPKQVGLWVNSTLRL